MTDNAPQRDPFDPPTPVFSREHARELACILRPTHERRLREGRAAA